MGEAILVLKESTYTLNPLGGKAVFRKKTEIAPKELPLIKSQEVDERIPYPLLNPIQTVFYHHYKEGNALVCAPTSAGKSLVAYLFTKNKEGRRIYTAPTKSLVYEKAVELKRYYSVDIRTGDNVLENYKRLKGEVLVSTYEYLVHSFRNGASWISEVSCIVFDEIHQIIKNWKLEEAITYALELGIPILGLSATLPSYEDIANWISAKLLIYSEWRPTELIRDAMPLKDFKEIEIYEERDKKLASKLFNALFELSKSDEQVILFVPNKKLGWQLLEVAKDEKVDIMNKTLPFEVEGEREPEIAFHNADVPKEEREEIEQAFREGRLKKLIATQTLAYGVNLPADRVIVMVKGIYERGKVRTIPDILDILQMEGRAGRFGIKEQGYSNILYYGIHKDRLIDELIRGLGRPIEKLLSERLSQDALSLFILLAYHYEGKNYERFLKKTFAFKNIPRRQILEVVEFLEDKGYVEGGRLTEKGNYCVRSGIPPTKFEEFLRRKSLNLDSLITIRPLLHMKKLDTLFYFVEKGESFEEDLRYVNSKLLICGKECFQDNTDQFIFYTEGLTFKYPNLSSPPGEFSYLGTDALHLIRTLIDLSKLRVYQLTTEEILLIAHSVKYGLTLDYALLGGIKGIGHIRANLLKRSLRSEYGRDFKLPPVGSRVEEVLEYVREEKLIETLITERKIDKEKAESEAKKVVKTLKNNKKGFLIDDKTLLAFGLFTFGERAYRMKKEELLKEVLWSLPNPS